MWYYQAIASVMRWWEDRDETSPVGYTYSHLLHNLNASSRPDQTPNPRTTNTFNPNRRSLTRANIESSSTPNPRFNTEAACCVECHTTCCIGSRVDQPAWSLGWDVLKLRGQKGLGLASPGNRKASSIALSSQADTWMPTDRPYL